MDEIMNAEQQDQGGAEVGLTDQTVADTGGDSVAETAAPMPDIEFDRNGQVVKVPFDQAKDYVSKGYDYTQKTQELAQMRESLKPYQEMESYLQANPDKAREVYNLLSGQAGQEIDPVQQKLAQQDMVLNQLVNQNAKATVDNMLSTINSDEKYEGLFKDKEMEEFLIANALQTRQMDMAGLKGVADRIHKKVLGFQVKSQKAGEQKVIQNLQSPTRKTEKGTGSFAPPAGFNPAKASWKELRERAESML